MYLNEMVMPMKYKGILIIIFGISLRGRSDRGVGVLHPPMETFRKNQVKL